MKIVLYQPDIPQNTGSFIRLCACMGVELHVIEPCGFVLDDKKLARVAMDYGAQIDIKKHNSWERFLDFCGSQEGTRLILLTTKTKTHYTDFVFAPNDMLLLGRESSGVPQEVHDVVDAKVTIPMVGSARSLNVAVTAGMVLGEALRQTRWK